MNEKFIEICSKKITVDLSKEEIKRNTISKWGEDVGGKNPSCSPRGESILRIFGRNPEEEVISSEFVNFAREKGLFLCNAQGLFVLESVDIKENILVIDEKKIELWVYGYDDNECLHYRGGYQIPFFKKNCDGTYFHSSCASNFVAHIDQLFLAFEKQ